MATATKVSLDVNVPLTGTVKFVDYYPEKPNPNQPGKTMADQWALTGTWEYTSPDGVKQAAEGKVYIDAYQLSASPVQLGFVEENGAWPDGNRRYKWTHTGPVRLLKTEDGRKRHVALSRLDGTTPATPAQQAPTAITGKMVRTDAHPGTESVAAQLMDDPWKALARQYERARAIACQVWGDNFDASALVAATATVFIEANKKGLTAHPQPNFDQMPPRLQQDEPMPWER
jgi:hypothetical protein